MKHGGGGFSPWQGHGEAFCLRAVIAQEPKDGPSNPLLILPVAALETSKGTSRPGPAFAHNPMASALHFSGLEVCEVIPKSSFRMCLGQNKHGEAWLAGASKFIKS